MLPFKPANFKIYVSLKKVTFLVELQSNKLCSLSFIIQAKSQRRSFDYLCLKLCNSTQDHVLFKQNSDNKKKRCEAGVVLELSSGAIDSAGRKISQQSEMSPIINNRNSVCLICISLGRKIDWKSPELGKTVSTGSTRLANTLLIHT